MGIPWDSNGNTMEIAWKSKREIRKSNGNPRGTIRISNGDHKQIPCVFVLGGGGVVVGGPRVTHHSECGVKFQANTQEIQGGPMETIRDPIRNHKGIPWESQANPAGNVRKSHGKCNKNPLGINGNPMGIPLGIHGNPVGTPWESNGNTMGIKWKSNGEPKDIH